ncbi:hypothetical protein [Nocardia wallacei]|uniref:hypothetical protein n=1 Tax=Nocardia wallacei TaxID=480035 RepID=UPI002458608F|nr:hypothetical protein [Nocardia wallacei]
MLPALTLLGLVTVARVRIWRIAPDSRRLTQGMAAIALSTLIFWPRIGERLIDPRTTLLGANFGDLAQHLLTITGCYHFGYIALENLGRASGGCWRILMTIVALALALTYRFSAEWRTPGEEFTQFGLASVLHNSILVGAMTVSFVLVAASVVLGRDDDAEPAVDWSFWGIFYMGVLGAACNVSVAAMMVAAPEFVRDNYSAIAEAFAFPALLALAWAGYPGLADAWRKRHDPRP